MGSRGFGDLGRMAIYFQGAGEPLQFILGELGCKLIILGIKGALPKSKKNLENLNLMVFFLYFFGF